MFKLMKKFYICATVLFLLFLKNPVYSENLANDKLLEILEQKGFLTKEEVESVKGILKKEEEKEVEVVYEEGLHIRTKDK